MSLQNYSAGTRVRIGDRIFRRTTTGTFWREEHQIPGNCVSRQSISLEIIERAAGVKHVVLAERGRCLVENSLEHDEHSQ